MEEDCGYFEDSFNDYMLVYQSGRTEVVDDVSSRARKLAALKRLYSVDYDGTWL